MGWGTVLGMHHNEKLTELLLWINRARFERSSDSATLGTIQAILGGSPEEITGSLADVIVLTVAKVPLSPLGVYLLDLCRDGSPIVWAEKLDRQECSNLWSQCLLGREAA